MTNTNSEAPFHLIAESAPDAIFISTDGRFVYVNPAAVTLFGARSASELLATLVIDRIHPDDREIVKERVRLLMERGDKAPLLEERYLRLDGSQIDVEVSAVPFRFDGKKSGLVFVRDISVRKQAEIALRRSEERFRMMFERNDAVMLLIEPKSGAIVDANAAASRFYGFSGAQLKKMSITDINPLSPQEIEQQRLRALEMECNYFIFPHRLANGEMRTVEIHATPITTENNTLLLSIIHDITARERAESELQQSKNLLQSIIDNTTSVIFAKDLAGRYMLINKRYEQLVHTEMAAMVGKTDGELFSAEVAQRLQEADRSVLASGHPMEFEEIVPLDDGLHTFLAVKFPLFDETGQSYAVCGIATDITERIRIQEEVEHLNQTLEQRVVERTRALHTTEAELRAALSLNENILKTTSQGIAVYRDDGQCILCNAGMSEITGGDRKALLKQNFRQLHSWKKNGLVAAAERVLSSGIREEHEAELTTSFNRRLWLHYQFSRLNELGTPHLLLIAQDISTQRRAAEILAKQEREFRTLAENVPDNILRTDRQARLLFCNPSMENFLGRPTQELQGMTLCESFPDGRYDALTEAILRVATHGSCEEFELVSRSDGRIRYQAIRIVAEHGDDGAPLSVLAVGRDLTEQRTAEEELRLAASVFHNSAEGVLITDADSTILSINPAFTEITGYTEEEALGKQPNMLRSDRHTPEFYTALWQQLASTGHWQGEIWNRRKGGEAFLEWLTINRIDDHKGMPIRYVAVFHDITELRQKDEHIHHLAFHDALTGLPNRSLLQDRIDHALKRAKRENGRLSVTFIDLDRFKAINDSLGHDIGDLLLQEVAQRIERHVRASDTVARMGGDEFVVLMEDLHTSGDCANLAEIILTEIAKPMALNGKQVTVGASMGMAFFPEDGDNTLELMKHADMAMYEAKATGRNTFRFFKPEMLQRVSHRLEMEMELRKALQYGELELHYQPKVLMASGKPIGAEALVRWRHPQKGLIPPIEFLPLARECGLISELGEWVLEEACRQIAIWQRQGHSIKLAINLSAQQLDNDNLVTRIHSATRRHNIEAASLEVELTESEIMDNPGMVIGQLESLRRLGVTIAVDDFGTGYSSLAYLKNLPLDVLKVDRSFVKEADSNQDDAQIIHTILMLGRTLNLAVVAEGIETPQQVKLLTSLGCEMAQGFYYSPPLTADGFITWWEGASGD